MGRRASITDEPALVRSRIGYIGQGNGGGHSFRVRDELVMQGKFYGMNSSDAMRRAHELARPSTWPRWGSGRSARCPAGSGGGSTSHSG